MNLLSVREQYALAYRAARIYMRAANDMGVQFASVWYDEITRDVSGKICNLAVTSYILGRIRPPAPRL